MSMVDRPVPSDTARLTFRPWRDDDADLELAVALWGNAEVTRLFGGPFDREHVAARVARERKNFEERGVQYWPIFLRATGEHVGVCGLRPYDTRPGDAGTPVYAHGFHLLPHHWRRGYGEEAARSVIDFAFRELHAAWIFAGHHPQNEPSRKLLAKLGFVYLRDELYPPTGLMHPSYRLDRG